MMAISTLESSQDLADLVQNLLNRVYKLEQRITSPAYVVPNGSSPTFTDVTIGSYFDGTSAGPSLIPTSSSPTNLTTSTTANFEDVSITGTWSAPVDGSAVEYEFQLYLKDTVAGTYSLAQVRRTTALTTSISGLIPGRTYGARVFGINRIGVQSATYPVSGFVDQVATPDATLPSVPSGFSVVAGTTSITAKWNDNTEVDVANAKGVYRVQIATDAAFTTNLDTRLTSGTIMAFTGLTAGTTYYLHVKAIDSSNNESGYTSTLSATAGSPGITSISDGSAPASSPTPTLTAEIGAIWARWTAPSNADYLTYEVHISTTNGFTPSGATKAGETDSTSFHIVTDGGGSGLSYASSYYVRIIAKDRDGSAAAGTQAGPVSPRKAAASDMVVGTITAASGIINDINANTITSGSMSATFITAGTFTSDRIVTAGLDAAVIKFGTMSGDRITANTLDVAALKTSTLTSTTITIGSTGQIKIGNPGVAGQYGVLLDQTGIRLYNGTSEAVRLDATNGTATLTGTINATGGTFSGSITASGTITGGTISGASINGATIVGGLFKTSNSFPYVKIDSANASNVEWWYGDFLGGSSNPQTQPFSIRLLGNTWRFELGQWSGLTAQSGGVMDFSIGYGGTTNSRLQSSLGAYEYYVNSVVNHAAFGSNLSNTTDIGFRISNLDSSWDTKFVLGREHYSGTPLTRFELVSHAAVGPGNPGHTSYDTAFVATGGSSTTAGQGTLTMYGGSFIVNPGLTVNAASTINGNFAIIAPGTAGSAHLRLHDSTNGVSKYLRNQGASGGTFEIINNAYTQAILQLTDTGNLTVAGTITSQGQPVGAGNSYEYSGTSATQTTTSTSYVIVTSGASGTFVAPPSGNVQVGISAYVKGTASYSHASYEVKTGGTVGSGTIILSGNSVQAVSNAGPDFMKATMINRVNGLTPGATYNIRALMASGSSGSTASVAGTYITINPL